MIEPSHREMRNAVEAVRSLEKPMLMQAEACSSVSRRMDSIAQSITDSSAIAAMDLLTDEEVEELRTLASLGESSREHATMRMSDPSAQGMYAQLSDLGLIHCVKVLDGSLLFIGIDPKAHWAIRRRDLLRKSERERAENEEKRRAKDRRNSALLVIAGWILGFLTTVIAPILSTKASQLIGLS